MYRLIYFKCKTFDVKGVEVIGSFETEVEAKEKASELALDYEYSHTSFLISKDVSWVQRSDGIDVIEIKE